MTAVYSHSWVYEPSRPHGQSAYSLASIYQTVSASLLGRAFVAASGQLYMLNPSGGAELVGHATVQASGGIPTSYAEGGSQPTGRATLSARGVLVGGSLWGTQSYGRAQFGTGLGDPNRTPVHVRLGDDRPPDVYVPTPPADLIEMAQLHLDASALPDADGSRLPVWDDFSLNGRGFSQAEVTKQPVLQWFAQNELAAVEFALGNETRQAGHDPEPDSMMIFLALRWGAFDGNRQYILDGLGATDRNAIYLDSDGIVKYFTVGTVGGTTNTGVSQPQGFGIWTFATGAPAGYVRLNGEHLVTSPNRAMNSGFVLGNRYSDAGGDGFTGALGELIVAPNLGLAWAQEVEEYLYTKWIETPETVHHNSYIEVQATLGVSATVNMVGQAHLVAEGLFFYSPRTPYVRVDEANSPTAGDLIATMSAVQHGETVHVAYFTGANVEYVTFDLATGTWGNREVVRTDATSGGTLVARNWTPIARGHDGTLYIEYSGVASLKGTDYRRANYVSKPVGGSWSTPVGLDAAGTTNWGPVGIVGSPDGRVFFFYTNADSQLLVRILLSGTLAAAQQVALGSGTAGVRFLGLPRAVAYSGQTYIHYTWLSGTSTPATFARFESAAMPSVQNVAWPVEGNVSALQSAQTVDQQGWLHALHYTSSGGQYWVTYFRREGWNAGWAQVAVLLPASQTTVSTGHATVYERSSLYRLSYTYIQGATEHREAALLLGEFDSVPLYRSASIQAAPTRTITGFVQFGHPIADLENSAAPGGADEGQGWRYYRGYKDDGPIDDVLWDKLGPVVDDTSRIFPNDYFVDDITRTGYGRVQLSPMSNPGPDLRHADGHRIHVRVAAWYYASGGSVGAWSNFVLYEGDTIIQSLGNWGVMCPGPMCVINIVFYPWETLTFFDHEFTLTAANAAKITDYSNLNVRFYTYTNTTGSALKMGLISYIRMIAPAPGPAFAHLTGVSRLEVIPSEAVDPIIDLDARLLPDAHESLVHSWQSVGSASLVLDDRGTASFIFPPHIRAGGFNGFRSVKFPTGGTTRSNPSTPVDFGSALTFIFAMVLPPQGPTVLDIFDRSSAALGYAFSRGSTGSWSLSGSSTISTSTGRWHYDQFVIMTCIINGSSSSIRINGATVASGNVGTRSQQGLTLGRYTDTAIGLRDTQMLRFLGWDRALPLAEVSVVEDWLREQYQVPPTIAGTATLHAEGETEGAGDIHGTAHLGATSAFVAQGQITHQVAVTMAAAASMAWTPSTIETLFGEAHWQGSSTLTLLVMSQGAASWTGNVAKSTEANLQDRDTELAGSREVAESARPIFA